jgi:hypothetical protein
MLIGIVRFPAVIDDAARVNMLAPGADIDVVAYGVDRNKPSALRSSGHSIIPADGLRWFTNIDAWPSIYT